MGRSPSSLSRAGDGRPQPHPRLFIFRREKRARRIGSSLRKRASGVSGTHVREVLNLHGRTGGPSCARGSCGLPRASAGSDTFIGVSVYARSGVSTCSARKTHGRAGRDPLSPRAAWSRPHGWAAPPVNRWAGLRATLLSIGSSPFTAAVYTSCRQVARPIRKGDPDGQDRPPPSPRERPGQPKRCGLRLIEQEVLDVIRE